MRLVWPTPNGPDFGETLEACGMVKTSDANGVVTYALDPLKPVVPFLLTCSVGEPTRIEAEW